MVYAERGNRVKTISEDDIQKYVDQGYTITNGYGTVIKNTVPTDVPNLKKAYVEHTAKIDSLQAEITKLTAENTALVAQIEELKKAKAEKPVEKSVATAIPEKTRATRKSNKAEE